MGARINLEKVKREPEIGGSMMRVILLSVDDSSLKQMLAPLG